MRSILFRRCGRVALASTMAAALSVAQAVQPTNALVDANTFDAPDSSSNEVPDIPGIGSPLGIESLDRLRGGDSVENKVDIHGTVEGNTAERIVSGDNTVQGGAFGNAAGINTLIQNTGSNVLIQNGMTVNVQFVAPGGP